MVPIIVSALCLWLVKSREAPAEAVPKAVYMARVRFPSIPVSSVKATMPVFKNNLSDPLTLEEYQTLLKPSLFDELPFSAATYFLRCLRQPHITQVARFDPLNRKAGQVQAYCQQFSHPFNCVWQIAAIDTVYGFIYLSLALDTDNTTGPVLISYDMADVPYYIIQTQAQQSERFGCAVFQHDQVAHSEELLKFFLGDVDHPYSIHHYLSKGN